jgi:hypothetical protein
MKPTLYALMAGIDRYPEPIPRLSGCVHDIKRMQEYLQARHDTDAYRLDLAQPLLDEQATRQAVIDGFRNHLRKARQGDVALFYYSGHGSQERAPKEFWHLEPDKLDETVVCWDSRQPGHHDLADKELAHLIEEVAGNGPHVLVILDCCHSGSGTRNIRTQQTAVRRLETDLRDRPLDSFIMTVADAERQARGPGGDASGWSASGRHVLLAACRDDEEALEYHSVRPDGQVEPRGTFSYFLGEALRSTTGPTTYRDLFARTSALVRAQVTGQSPQLESTLAEDLDAQLFNGAIRPSAPYYTLSNRDGSWWIDGGAVHGLPPLSPDEDTLLDAFLFGASDEELRDSKKAAARVKLVSLESTRSQVEAIGDGSLDPGTAYKAVVVALPLPRITVVIEPEQGPGAEWLRKALAHAEGDKPSLYVREVPPGSAEPARFRLRVENAGYGITSPESDRLLVAPIPGLDEGSARLAIQRLEHMARWTLALELANGTTSIQPTDVVMTLLDEDDRELQGSEIRLEYRLRDGKPQPSRFKLKLKNQSPDKTLYCGLLDLAQDYSINAGLHEAGCVRLDPGEEAWAAKGQFIFASLLDKYWRQGLVEFKDVLKLIVSDGEFDVRLMALGPLELPSTKSTTRGLPPPGALNRLMQRVVTRNLTTSDPAGEIGTWWTGQVAFTTVRPQESTPVPSVPGRSAALAGGVRILDHPSFRANARLSTAPVSSRDLGAMVLPRLLRDDPSVSLPFPLVATRGAEPNLSTLELTDIEGDTYKSVTPDQPLKLLLPRTLEAEESVLPVGYDGEFFLPLGRAVPAASGTTELVLERLPEPTTAGERSLTGSIKIFFQKIFGQRIGIPSEYPILAAATRLDRNNQVVRTKEPAEVRRLVDAASTILLYVHGIIGDTQEMASSALKAGFDRRYNLILTFDYENLNTKISENARLLGERLAAVGLGPGHVKTLDIAAHSMGGLVSRWFIEQGVGKQVVHRLVMLGTPNGGSPWPNVVDWATTALALGLNELTAAAWPSIVLKGLTRALGDPRVTLKEMESGSPTLVTLGQGPDPGIPYAMLAGNTSIIPAPQAHGAIGRLLNKLFGTNPAYAFANPFFQNAVNDIAVAVESMKRLPAGRSMTLEEVACDHLSYFHDEKSLAALARVLGG